jgi:alkylation response protein AidB-like acyl-CoA dehydrogenase
VGVRLQHMHRALFEEIRTFTHDMIQPAAARHDVESTLSPELVHSLADAGYLGAFLPAEAGGRGFDWISYGLLHECIGTSCTSTRSLVTVHDMVAHTIWRWGTTEQRDRWLPELAHGRTVAAFALTEPHNGSDAAAIETTARSDANGYILDGVKKWISFGPIADIFLVFARLERGFAGFLIPRDTPGLTITALPHLLGARATMPSELRFTGCHIDGDAVISPRGRAVPQITTSALTIGRLGVAAGSVGMLQGCADEAYLHARSQRGVAPPLLEHQLIQRLLAGIFTDLDAGRLLWMNAATSLSVDDPRAPMAMMTAKHFAAAAAARGTRDAVQVLGAAGCTSDYRSERFFRDAKVMELIEGSTEIQQITIGRYGYSDASAMFAVLQ